jgi:hypothetical protein
VLTGVRRIRATQRAAANAHTNSNGRKRRLELTAFTFGDAGTLISADRIISRQLGLTAVIFPITLVFSNSSH